MGMLVIYRIGFFIPLPGVDQSALKDWAESAASGGVGNLISYVGIFTGGSLSQSTILSGGGTAKPKLDYLPEGYEFMNNVNIFASGKDGIFIPGTPIGVSNISGEVDLFVDPNQLSFVTVILKKNEKKF